MMQAGAMQGKDERFDGWKAIARHLGRDRSTVIRWANERGLPVHSLPGGKSRTVYALREELDVWMRGGGPQGAVGSGDPVPDVVPDEPAASTPPPPIDPLPSAEPPSPPLPLSAPRSRRWPTLAAAAAVAVVAVAVPAAIYLGPEDSSTPAPVATVTLDPAAQARLLKARDDIASRSEPRLQDAIGSLRAMSARTPGHGGIHEALAEGYLLAREFGSLPDALALEKARQEARTVLRLNPGSSTGLRVLGVVAYWRDRDTRLAGETFRHAIAADPQDALARQWYANILADNGEYRAAFREFAAARSLSPGAAYLLADYAWGLWSAGREREAEAVLDDLAARYPGLASVHDCLSVTAFARRDFAGYAHHLKLRAAARGAPELIGYSRLVDETMRRGESALYDVMLTRGLTYAEAQPLSDHSWPAFVASVFGDRAQLLSILRRAGERDERWGASGFTRRIAVRWGADPAIVAAIRRLVQPPIEPSSATLRRFAT
jgi:tetratricopeptide (TPR) repeat protein